MKKILLLLAIFLLVSLQNSVNASQSTVTNVADIPFGVLCNDDKTTCTIGNYTFKSRGASEPIFVYGGIMCNSTRTTCTNGYSVLRSSYAQY